MHKAQKKSEKYSPGGEDQCIQCGKCLEVCPVLDATGAEELSPRSKLVMLKRMAEDPAVFAEKDAASLAGLCLTCGRCTKACSQDTDVPAAVAFLRSRHKGFTSWLWKTWIERSSLLWPAAAKAGKVGIGRPLPESLSKKLSSMASSPSFEPWLKASASTACPSGRKAVLFPGCLARNVRKDWTAKAEILLDMAGVETTVAKWDCCGGTLLHAGMPDRAEKAAAANVDQWRAVGRPEIVTFCASCGHSLAAYPTAHAELFEEGEDEQWSGALVSLFDMLGCLTVEKTPAAPEAVTYHKPCHAPASDPDGAWLMNVAEENFVPAQDARCCGMGGILQLGAPDLSEKVASRMWEGLADEDAHVLTACSGCWLQLVATLPEGRTAAHLLDAIDIERE